MEGGQENTQPTWQIPYLLPQILNPLLPFQAWPPALWISAPLLFTSKWLVPSTTHPGARAAPEQSRAGEAHVQAAANTRVCYRVHSWTGSVKQSDELLQFSKNMARISILRHYQLREQSFLFRLEQNGSHRALWWGINGLLLGGSTRVQVLDHFCT